MNRSYLVQCTTIAIRHTIIIRAAATQIPAMMATVKKEHIL